MSSGTELREQCRLSTYSTCRLQPLKIGMHLNMLVFWSLCSALKTNHCTKLMNFWMDWNLSWLLCCWTKWVCLVGWCIRGHWEGHISGVGFGSDRVRLTTWLYASRKSFGCRRFGHFSPTAECMFLSSSSPTKSCFVACAKKGRRKGLASYQL